MTRDGTRFVVFKFIKLSSFTRKLCPVHLMLAYCGPQLLYTHLSLSAMIMLHNSYLNL
jgi:hypothetical protein